MRLDLPPPPPPLAHSLQVIVSAGFDAVDGDPLGECRVTPLAFDHMTRSLSSLGKPLALLLEGGYNLQQTAGATEQVNYRQARAEKTLWSGAA